MNGHTTLRAGGHEVISSGSVIPFGEDDVTELLFDYEDFKLRITLKFRDSTDEEDKNRNYYSPKWIDGEPNTLELSFTNAVVKYGPGGPTDPIKLGTSKDSTLYLRIRLFGVNSKNRYVIYYTVYSVIGENDDE